MRGFFNGLVLGLILGALAYWFFQRQMAEHPEAQQRYGQPLSQLGASAEETAHNVSETMRAKLEALDLRPDEIKQDLVRDGQVFRRKAEDIGEAAANAASDAKVVTEIKAKYAADSTLSAWDISVSCHQGHVKLSGTVPSSQDIGRAMAMALDTAGVRDATSTLTVKQK